MIYPAIRKAFLSVAFTILVAVSYSQKSVLPQNTSFKKTERKPYKVLTSAKRITIKSEVSLKSLLIWSAKGHRVVEQTNMAVQEFSYTINISENIFFLLLELENGKRYTEKIGVSSPAL